MLEGTVRVINPLGLHARAAAQLVRLATTFESRILITRKENGTTADAKSILSVLALAAPFGTEMHLRVEGADEEKAYEAAFSLFAKGFDEI